MVRSPNLVLVEYIEHLRGLHVFRGRSHLISTKAERKMASTDPIIASTTKGGSNHCTGESRRD
jgi:hypothetical protein